MNWAQFTVPEGVGAGEMMKVTLDDGRELELQVPHGLQAGDEFKAFVGPEHEPEQEQREAGANLEVAEAFGSRALAMEQQQQEGPPPAAAADDDTRYSLPPRVWFGFVSPYTSPYDCSRSQFFALSFLRARLLCTGSCPLSKCIMPCPEIAARVRCMCPCLRCQC
eukprot:COSAG05_NODE_3649_length_1932_cov_1.097109_3_plen_165_part_00